MATCTCPVGHPRDPALKDWDENCPIHGLAASQDDKRPDAAPPKELPDAKPGEKQHLLSGYVDAQGWPQPGAPPKEGSSEEEEATRLCNRAENYRVDRLTEAVLKYREASRGCPYMAHVRKRERVRVRSDVIVVLAVLDAHQEDAPLKQTPGNINESGDVKGDLQGGEETLWQWHARNVRKLIAWFETDPSGEFPVTVAWLQGLLMDCELHPADAPGGPCSICADVLKQLRGHPDSKLDGENGLAAATMREVDRLKAAPKSGTNVPTEGDET